MFEPVSRVLTCVCPGTARDTSQQPRLHRITLVALATHSSVIRWIQNRGSRLFYELIKNIKRSSSNEFCLSTKIVLYTFSVSCIIHQNGCLSHSIGLSASIATIVPWYYHSNISPADSNPRDLRFTKRRYPIFYSAAKWYTSL